jgi:hypothetical protein
MSAAARLSFAAAKSALHSFRSGTIYANIRQSERGVAARFISNSVHFEKRKRQSTKSAPANNSAL